MRFLIFVLALTTACYGQPGTHPVTDRPIAGVMGVAGADCVHRPTFELLLERQSRRS